MTPIGDEWVAGLQDFSTCGGLAGAPALLAMDGWTGVELRHLAALAAIDAERSFRGAADRLGYVQSAVSQQIAQLELLVGVRLVERARGHSRPVTLTEAGMLLLEHARRILGQIDAAAADMRALAEGGAQTLRIGIDPTVATRLVPAALRKLTAHDPSVRIELEEASSDREHVERVERGQLDAAFGELPLDRDALECAKVIVDPCVLLVPRNSRLADPTIELELADVVAEPLVGLAGWPTMRRVEAELASVGLQLRIAMEATTPATVQALVGAGVGPAILPCLAVQEDDPLVVAIDMSQLLPERSVVLYWHQGRRTIPALTALHASAVSAAREVRRAHLRREAARATQLTGQAIAPVPASLSA